MCVFVKFLWELWVLGNGVLGVVFNVLGMSCEEGWLVMEWIEGVMVKVGIWGWEVR